MEMYLLLHTCMHVDFMLKIKDFAHDLVWLKGFIKLVTWSLFILVGIEFLFKDVILSLEVALDSLIEWLLNRSNQWRSQDLKIRVEKKNN